MILNLQKSKARKDNIVLTSDKVFLNYVLVLLSIQGV